MAVLTRPFRPTVASSLLLSVAATLYGLVIYYSARPVVRDAPDRLVPTLINDNYLEADYALDGACYAGTDPKTPHLPPPNSFGAFGPSTNFPRKVCEDSKGKGLFL